MGLPNGQSKYQGSPDRTTSVFNKEEIGSESAKIFDPLLLFAPVTIQAKQFLKEVWIENWLG